LAGEDFVAGLADLLLVSDFFVVAIVVLLFLDFDFGTRAQMVQTATALRDRRFLALDSQCRNHFAGRDWSGRLGG
jgi:hypothetical protein